MAASFKRNDKFLISTTLYRNHPGIHRYPLPKFAKYTCRFLAKFRILLYRFHVHRKHFSNFLSTSQYLDRFYTLLENRNFKIQGIQQNPDNRDNCFNSCQYPLSNAEYRSHLASTWYSHGFVIIIFRPSCSAVNCAYSKLTLHSRSLFWTCERVPLQFFTDTNSFILDIIRLMSSRS